MEENLKIYGEQIKKLGQGTFGSVYEYKCSKTGDCVAIKKFRGSEDEGISSDNLREIAILNKYKHPNIIKLLAVAPKKPTVSLVLEKMDLSLSEYLKKKPAYNYDLNLSYMYQLVRALDFLHNNNVWHRDIKPGNILIGTDGRAVLADLGLGRFGALPSNMYTTEVESAPYRATELLLWARSYGPEIDVFSLGVTFIEMFTQSYLFWNEKFTLDDILLLQIKTLGHVTDEYWPGVSSMPNYNERIKKYAESRTEGTLNDILKPYKDDLKTEGIDLLKSMTYPNPSKRITIAEVKKSSLFDKTKTLVDSSIPAPKVKDNLICGEQFRSNVKKVVLDDSIKKYAKTLNPWLLEVTEKFRLLPTTLFYARQIMDIYIDYLYKKNEENEKTKKKTSTQMANTIKKILQNIGVSSLFIAGKIFEIYSPEANDYKYITDHSVSIPALLLRERAILNSLNYELVIPTTYEFLYYYGKNIDSKYKLIAKKLALAYNGTSNDIDADRVAQISIFIAIHCAKNINPTCKVNVTIEEADKFLNDIKNIKPRAPRLKLWKIIDPVIDGWETCKNNMKNNNVNDREEIEIIIPKSEGLLTPTKTKNDKIVEKVVEDIKVTNEKPNEKPYKVSLNLEVTRAEREDISREELIESLNNYIMDQAVNFTNIFNFQKNIDYFADYFHLSKTKDNKYHKPNTKLNRIEYNLGPMMTSTNATVTFTNVDRKYHELFNMFENTLKTTKYNKKIHSDKLLEMTIN